MNGIHTAMVTPFAEDGSVDLDTFAVLCGHQIDAGIHGLVACGTTGETPTLDDSEWAAVVRAAVEVSAGRVPVSAGVGTNNTRSTVQKIAQAAELGASTGLLVLPYYNKPNADGLRQHMREALAVGLPLVVYHVPGRTGQRLDHRLLAELVSMKGVVAVKEATGDLRYTTDLIALTQTHVLSGDDFTFLGVMAQGGTGCISVVSNVAPARTVCVYEAFVAGRVVEAWREFRALWELTTYLFADASPVPCKAALAALGLCRPDVRPPLAMLAEPASLEMVKRALA
jgi:4-hydroxy-tetrahydrodipicolinate synthase